MSIDLFALFGAGLLAFLSPCVLPLAPTYLGLLAGATASDVKAGRVPRPIVPALGFVGGLATVLIALGMAAGAAGQFLQTHRALLLAVGATVTLVFALKSFGLLRFAVLERESRPLLERLPKVSGAGGAYLFGAAFGLGWTPCIGPVLGAALTWTASKDASLGGAALSLGAFAAGLGLPLVAIAALAPRLLPVLQGLRAHGRKIEFATGVLLVASAAWMGQQAWERSRVSEPCALTDDGIACGMEANAAGAAQPNERLVLPEGEAHVVAFVGESCPTCRALEPVLQSVEESCGHVPVARVNAVSGAGRAEAQSRGIVGVPTLLFVDAAGIEQQRIVGEAARTELVRAFEALKGSVCAG